jgi:hypothetical protein
MTLPPRAVGLSRSARRPILTDEDVTASNREAALFQAGFENWLKQQLRAGIGYDQLVRALLAAPIATEARDPEPVLRDPEQPNPLAFFAVKEARPENLAAAVSRSFLGIRLECAQWE